MKTWEWIRAAIAVLALVIFAVIARVVWVELGGMQDRVLGGSLSEELKALWFTRLEITRAVLSTILVLAGLAVAAMGLRRPAQD